MEEILKVENVWKIYKEGNVKAVQNVNFTIKKGDFVSIIGRSGSGKSTLLHIIGLMDTPTHGKVYLMGKEVGSLDEEEKVKIRGKSIGFIFQSFNLMNELNTVENVAVAGMLNGMPYFEAINKAKSLLEKIGLENRIKQDISKLSGGERQRVAIARALINEPLIILGDEPTGNLDTKTRDQIMDYLTKLNEEGMTIIIVTHDLEIAQRAKNIIRLQDGKIVKSYKITKKSGRIEFFQREKIENAIIKAGGSSKLAEIVGSEIENMLDKKSSITTSELKEKIISILIKNNEKKIAEAFKNYEKTCK